MINESEIEKMNEIEIEKLKEIEKMVGDKSNVLHPGNGYNFPQQGDYVKIQMKLMDANTNKTIFDTSLTKKKCLDFRYKCNDSNIFHLLEILIGKMCLFEKSQLILDLNDIPYVSDSIYISSLLQDYGKLSFEVEVLHISKSPHIL